MLLMRLGQYLDGFGSKFFLASFLFAHVRTAETEYTNLPPAEAVIKNNEGGRREGAGRGLSSYFNANILYCGAFFGGS